jgi:hypothetical protein
MSDPDDKREPRDQPRSDLAGVGDSDQAVAISDAVMIGDLPIVSLLGGSRIETRDGSVLVVPDSPAHGEDSPANKDQEPARFSLRPYSSMVAGKKVKGTGNEADAKIDNTSAGEQPTSLSSQQALSRIADAVQLNLGQLQLNIEKARHESGQFFRATFLFATCGFAIILLAICLMMANFVKAGIVSAAASLVPQVGAALIFKKDSELRRTIEAYHNHILESQRVLTMIDLAETVDNMGTKDSIKEQIVFAVLKVKTNQRGTRPAHPAG